MKGYSQIFGIDYSYAFALVAKPGATRKLLIIIAQNGWQVFHMDVKSAFLMVFLQKEIYVEKP